MKEILIISRGKGIWARPKENLAEEFYVGIPKAQLVKGKGNIGGSDGRLKSTSQD